MKFAMLLCRSSFRRRPRPLHTRLEAEFTQRYANLKKLAEAEYEPAEVSGELAAAGEGDSDACTLAGTAEHSGRAGADDACDDGPGRKIRSFR